MKEAIRMLEKVIGVMPGVTMRVIPAGDGLRAVDSIEFRILTVGLVKEKKAYGFIVDLPYIDPEHPAPELILAECIYTSVLHDFAQFILRLGPADEIDLGQYATDAAKNYMAWMNDAEPILPNLPQVVTKDELLIALKKVTELSLEKDRLLGEIEFLKGEVSHLRKGISHIMEKAEFFGAARYMVKKLLEGKYESGG